MMTHKAKMHAHELGWEIAIALGYDPAVLRWYSTMYHWATSDSDPLPQWWLDSDAAWALCIGTKELVIQLNYNASRQEFRADLGYSWTLAFGKTPAEALCRAFLKLRTHKNSRGDWTNDKTQG